MAETVRRLLDAFGAVAELVKIDWRTLELHIHDYNNHHAESLLSGKTPCENAHFPAKYAKGNFSVCFAGNTIR